MATVTGALSETLAVGLVQAPVVGRPMALGDMLNLHDTPRAIAVYQTALVELLEVLPEIAHGRQLNAAIVSRFVLYSAAHAALPAFIREHLRLGAVLTASQRTMLAEALRLVAAQGVQGHYALTVSEVFRLYASLTRGLAAFLREHLEVSTAPTALYRAIALLTEELELRDVLAPKLVVVVVAAEHVVLGITDVLQSIYNATLQEGVDFIVDTVDPSGDITTWAVNVRTGAVTEYLNYGFNSLARSAAGTYLGASDEGLYELTGADDAGEPVIGDMISGLIEFSGAHLSSIKAAYLSVRGDGQYYLKLTEGTGRNATYRIQAQSLKTARVDIGKGLRARFFTFELLSTGQEFDLQGLTFIPIQQTRRV